MGEKCHYAHGSEELRRPSLVGVTKSYGGFARGGEASYEPKVVSPPSNGPSPKHKIVLCKYFAQGSCKNAERCTFAHGEEELRLGFAPIRESREPPRENASVTIRQLEFILEKLSKLHPSNTNVRFALKNAEELLREDNYHQAADTLQKIITDPELGELYRDVHDQIVSEAQLFGVKLAQKEKEKEDSWCTPPTPKQIAKSDSVGPAQNDRRKKAHSSLSSAH